MTDRRRIDSLFDAALDLPEPERSDFLNRECPSGPLREAVDRLLEAVQEEAEEETQVLSTAAGERLIRFVADELPSTGPPQTVSAGTYLGPFRVVRELGRGGSAVVYLAERADGQFSQRVALKVLAQAPRDHAAFPRFQLEREILATLDHPNIARIFDGGVTEDGRPFYAMELVDGLPFDAYCRQRQLTVRQRVELFIKICRAVGSAHQRGVVHRDLKPSNILVSKEGDPKLLDFGIAKLVGSKAALHSPVVTTDQLPMTPEYASPEQFRGETVTTASDVYQLGLLLYEVLTGTRAHSIHGLTPAEAQDVVCTRRPTRPSTAVRQTAQARRGDTPPDFRPSEIARQLSGDLDILILKALSKDPERRYGSVPQLVEDLQRYLDGRPILARPDSAAYRLYRFAGRHRWAVASTATVALIFAAMVVFYTLRLREERNLAALEATKARQVSAFLDGLFEQADPFARGGEGLTAREMLDRGAARISTELAEQPLVQAEMQRLLGTIYRRLGLYDQARPLLDQALEQYRRHRGEDHRETAEAYFRRAVLDFNTARFEEAEKGHLRALEIWRGAGGADDPDIPRVLADLSLVYARQSRLEEARHNAERALELLARQPEPPPNSRARTLNTLALVLRQQGEYHLAAERFEEALELYAQGPEPENPSIASIHTNLGTTLTDLGRLEEAQVRYLAALDIVKRQLGPSHPLVGAQLINLGSLSIQTRRYDEALGYLDRALPALEAALGKDHLRVGLAHLNLAAAHSFLGDADRAFDHLRRGRRILRASYRPEHPMQAIVVQLEGELLLRQGRLQPALTLLKRALGHIETSAGADHPMTGDVLVSLAEAQMAVGEIPAAESSLRRALAIREASLPEDHRDRANCHRRLGLCLEAQGHHSQAAEQMRKAMRIAEMNSSSEDLLLREILEDSEAFFSRWADQPLAP